MANENASADPKSDGKQEPPPKPSKPKIVLQNNSEARPKPSGKGEAKPHDPKK